MEHNKIKKFKKFNKIVFGVCIVSICIITQTKFARAEEDNVIKVGYPIVKGFTEIKNGVYSGYAYEYLSEIVKYTGWEYEFVEMSLADSLEALKDGEVDIVAGMFKNDETMKIYDFPDYDMGDTYETLSTLRKENGIFVDFVNLIFKKLDIKLDLIKVKNYEEAYKMVHEKKADLIVGVPGEYSSADKNGIKLTASYLNLEMVSVVRKDNQNQGNRKKLH